MASLILGFVTAAVLYAITYLTYHIIIAPRFNPLQKLPGPPITKWFGNHLIAIMDPSSSSRAYDILIKRYGRSMRIRGLGPWDERLLTIDPLAISHVLKNSTIYEKPWQSRRLITSLVGCGMLGAEGQVHKRQRRVATPAFSLKNMRALVPLVFSTGTELKDKWMEMIENSGDKSEESIRLDMCSWISRATFDVIGVAGFDYHFHAIQDETNELFLAYKDMFEIALSQGGKSLRTIAAIYFPRLFQFFPDKTTRTVERCLEVINRVAGHLIQEKKRKIEQGGKTGQVYDGKDLLSLLLMSNVSTDISPEQRISDQDILDNINTFLFAGSDTSSLALTWTLLLLAQNPSIQSRLRAELLAIAPVAELSTLTSDEIESFYTTLSDLPYLHNIVCESLRLVPPVHSSLRVATQDDEIPTMYPVHRRDGTIDETRHSVSMPKGSFINIPIEAFNLDKEVWGEDAWEFNPDRWDNLPEAVLGQPGIFSNLLTFSAGPRSCIGVRFSLIEIKTFLHILLTNFEFIPTDDPIMKVNVVLTRPYIKGKFLDGSQCPIIVKRYVALE